jgi:hypothetical protein
MISDNTHYAVYVCGKVGSYNQYPSPFGIPLRFSQIETPMIFQRLLPAAKMPGHNPA